MSLNLIIDTLDFNSIKYSLTESDFFSSKIENLYFPLYNNDLLRLDFHLSIQKTYSKYSLILNDLKTIEIIDSHFGLSIKEFYNLLKSIVEQNISFNSLFKLIRNNPAGKCYDNSIIDYELYYTALAADAVILDENNNILLIRRKKNPYQGYYALPGGKFDEGEFINETVIREVKEETGLNIDVIKKIGIFNKEGRDPRGRFLSVAFLCRKLDPCQVPYADSDAETVEIVPISKINNIPLAFDHLDIIKKALK